MIQSPDRKHLRALALLASHRNGCTEAVMLNRDYSGETILDLILGGLASFQIEGARIKITAKGRLALRIRQAKIESHDQAVEAALEAYPLLTREEAEEIAAAFGF